MTLEDWSARFIGGAGVLIAVGSLLLTLYLWLRSGPVVRVSAFVRPETGMIRIEVANTGRLPATIRLLELRDQTVLKVTGGQGGTAELSRWAIAVPLNDADTSIELAPTAFVEVDYPATYALERASGA